MMNMNRLKDLRTEQSITQTEIAKYLKIKQNSYSQYENEKRDMPTIILRKLSKLYKTNIDYILGLTNIKKLYPNSKIINNNPNLNRLKEIREDKDLKQYNIAKILGIVQSSYSPYETGELDISTKKLIQLAIFYNVSIDYILYLTDERTPYKRNSNN